MTNMVYYQGGHRAARAAKKLPKKKVQSSKKGKYIKYEKLLLLFTTMLPDEGNMKVEEE